MIISSLHLVHFSSLSMFCSDFHGSPYPDLYCFVGIISLYRFKSVVEKVKKKKNSYRLSSVTEETVMNERTSGEQTVPLQLPMNLKVFVSRPYVLEAIFLMLRCSLFLYCLPLCYASNRLIMLVCPSKEILDCLHELWQMISNMCEKMSAYRNE